MSHRGKHCDGTNGNRGRELVISSDLAALERERLRQDRIKRLLQVREQSKRLSESRLKKYKDNVDESWGQVVSSLQTSWCAKQQKLLKEAPTEPRLGFAHKQADNSVQEYHKRVENLKASLKEGLKKDAARANVAASEFREETRQQQQEWEGKLRMRDQVLQKEKARAHQAAILGKARAIDQQQVAPLMQLENTSDKGRRKATRDYNQTSYNRDYVAVRCDVQGKKVEDAMTAAEKARTTTFQETNARRVREQHFDEQREKRFQTAVRELAMQKEMQQVYQQLETLAYEDRTRLQTNVHTRRQRY
ncbi:hypothetical protein HK102_005353 [Quaeritorhiza haematococci]|nr:hypothetical protein HK102_005353 [Quaeritorhiza haematococci]